MTDQPEPCIKASGRCYSPMACGGFGYCRERNSTGVPTPKQAVMLRDIAVVRKIIDAAVTPGGIDTDIVTIRMTKRQAAMTLASIDMSIP